jgi:asparagine synthase (glutamine-hydrolysing)
MSHPKATAVGRANHRSRSAVKVLLGRTCAEYAGTPTGTSATRRRSTAVCKDVLLSGGLDSSLLVALFGNGAGNNNLKTFSIGFERVGDLAGDEFHYSDLIAQTFGTDHHRIHIDSARALSALPSAVAAMSEPMTSHDAIGFYLLSQEVSKHIKVVQSGQGADEVFGGYHWYPRMMR